MSNSNPGLEFGNDYFNSLQELTFNSRPIIESHTLLAQENSIYASEIVSAIERRIERAIPNQKLFALYLMDSISKNVGLPYTTLFSKNLLKTFMRTYSLVDDPTRVRLIKLFKTWKIPTALTGLPLFDSRQLDQIEQFLIKATAANNNTNNTNNINNNTGSINATTLSKLDTPPIPQSLPLNDFYKNTYNDDPRLLLVRDIEDLTNMVNSRLIGSPNDEKALQRFNLLNQLKHILLADSNLPTQQLDSVRQQLQSIRNDEMMKLNVLKQIQQKQQQKQQIKSPTPPLLQTVINNNFNTANAQALFTMMSSVATQKQQQIQKSPNEIPASLNQLLGGSITNSSPSPDGNNSFRGSLGLNNLSFLQNILNKTGTGSASSPPPSSLSGKLSSTNGGEQIDFGFIQPKKEQLISQFSLTESFIQGHKPNNFEIDLLYPKDSSQCSNCSKRFANTYEGHLEKQNHLDWHFRINKRIMPSTGGGVVNRSWYLQSDEWINFTNNPNPTFIQTSTPPTKRNAPVDDFSGFKDNRNEDEKMNDHIVPIPQGASNEVICDVCKELIHGVFDEDTGEWIWKGVISHRGTIRHYICHLETSKRDRSPQRERP